MLCVLSFLTQPARPDVTAAVFTHNTLVCTIHKGDLGIFYQNWPDCLTTHVPVQLWVAGRGCGHATTVIKTTGKDASALLADACVHLMGGRARVYLRWSRCERTLMPISPIHPSIGFFTFFFNLLVHWKAAACTQLPVLAHLHWLDTRKTFPILFSLPLFAIRTEEEAASASAAVRGSVWAGAKEQGGPGGPWGVSLNPKLFPKFLGAIASPRKLPAIPTL